MSFQRQQLNELCCPPQSGPGDPQNFDGRSTRNGLHRSGGPSPDVLPQQVTEPKSERRHSKR